MIAISELFVFRVVPNRPGSISEKDLVGGSINATKASRNIFESSFNGKIGRGIKLQPFHFQFSGKERSNEARDLILQYMNAIRPAEKRKFARKLAYRLSRLIDNRTGDLLMTIAYGKDGTRQRMAIWAYPQDDPIRLSTVKGVPKIEEIQNAFSKSSILRKAAYFEENEVIGRGGLLGGEIIDSAAGRENIETNYWLSQFLAGLITLLSARGTNQIMKAIKAAQESASSDKEKSSIVAVVHSLTSGAIKNTTINEIGKMLVGEAKTIYGAQFRTGIELDARFEVDQKEVFHTIKNSIIRLKNGIEVYFPLGKIDPDNYITTVGVKKVLKLEAEIESEFYK
jgi:hypothetical protein